MKLEQKFGILVQNIIVKFICNSNLKLEFLDYSIFEKVFQLKGQVYLTKKNN